MQELLDQPGAGVVQELLDQPGAKLLKEQGVETAAQLRSYHGKGLLACFVWVLDGVVD